MTWRGWVLLAALFAIIAGTFIFPRIPQDPAYHNFADQRRLLGIPNFLDVASNVFFLFVGLAGLRFVSVTPLGRSSPFSDSVDRWSYFIFFAAVGATAIGSGYYHLRPNNETLVWDRLPMAAGFLALLAAVVCERIALPDKFSQALCLLPILGIATVFYWQATERNGHGDLRPYAVAQFGTLVAILLVLILFSSRFTHGADFYIALALYGVAKVLEETDRLIYSAGRLLSGHSLKHIAAAISTYWILRMLQRRRPLVSSETSFNQRPTSQLKP
jgi:hypothetical protein